MKNKLKDKLRKMAEEDSGEVFDNMDMTVSVLEIASGEGSFFDWFIIILGAISKFFTRIFSRFKKKDS